MNAKDKKERWEKEGKYFNLKERKKASATN